MRSVVGIFTGRDEAERAAGALAAMDIPRDRITVLVPGRGEEQLARVPTTEAEPPGVGRVLGGVVGTAAGAAGGIHSGLLLSFVVPGVGPVMAMGALGAVLLGVSGVALGEALDRSLREGLPRDEIYLYEDALRQGRSVVVALAGDAGQAEAARQRLAGAGAESLDAARERWWIGLRQAEAAAYPGRGAEETAFGGEEEAYRRGFEAALTGGREGRSWDEARPELQRRHPDLHASAAFRRGYERGLEWSEGWRRRPAA